MTLPTVDDQEVRESMHARVDNDFAFHPATDDEKRMAHTSVREKMKAAAHFVVDNVPSSREQSLALTALEEAMHWANAAIAKNNPVGV